MKKIFLSIVLLLVCSCSNNTYKSINKEESLKLIKEKDAVLIDVRSAVEYQNYHIEGAESYPLTTILNDIEKYYDKDTYIIVYCKSGSRSKTAANGLIELGYKHIYDLGSIDNWD